MRLVDLPYHFGASSADLPAEVVMLQHGVAAVRQKTVLEHMEHIHGDNPLNSCTQGQNTHSHNNQPLLQAAQPLCVAGVNSE
jgi:hypothetical protein